MDLLTNIPNPFALALYQDSAAQGDDFERGNPYTVYYLDQDVYSGVVSKIS